MRFLYFLIIFISDCRIKKFTFDFGQHFKYFLIVFLIVFFHVFSFSVLLGIMGRLKQPPGFSVVLPRP